jgi:hypothetical protein
VTGIAPVIHELIHDLEKRIVALQARMAELESSALKYCGVYQPSVSYQRGNVVTCHGSAFHATRTVSAERPGTTDGWQLMVTAKTRPQQRQHARGKTGTIRNRGRHEKHCGV